MHIVVGVLLGLLVIVICTSLPALIVMLAWNLVMVPVFHIGFTLGFWQAWLALAVLGIVFRLIRGK